MQFYVPNCNAPIDRLLRRTLQRSEKGLSSKASANFYREDTKKSGKTKLSVFAPSGFKNFIL